MQYVTVFRYHPIRLGNSGVQTLIDSEHFGIRNNEFFSTVVLSNDSLFVEQANGRSLLLPEKSFDQTMNYVFHQIINYPVNDYLFL